MKATIDRFMMIPLLASKLIDKKLSIFWT